ncbi:MAG: hypothetical protein NC904_03135 [Candidatus Omnitrophica bacterium]|nr:hypothetical protein [Candidatus Omnitrophota bacterium]
MDEKIAKVVFNIPVNKEFDYLCTQENIDKGKRVEVEFNRRKMLGIVTSISSKTSITNLKSISNICDTYPSLSEEKLEFAKKLAKKYILTWGEVIFMMLPNYLKRIKFVDLPPLLSSYIGKDKSKVFVKLNSFYKRYQFYKKQIQEILENNSVILCLPLIDYLKEVSYCIEEDFPGKVVLVHSSNSSRENFLSWLEIRKGRRLILGTPMSLFYYPEDLGLIILEEENSPYYSQQKKPYFNILDIVVMLSEFKNIKVILSGNYPTLFTYRMYKEDKIILVDGYREDKRIEILDFKNFYYKRKNLFTPFVIELMRKKLEEGKNILILWSRKNYSLFLRCNQCGYVIKCRRCSSYLKLSLEKKLCVCSWCGYYENIVDKCKICNSGYMVPVGVGIERLESIVRKIFPEFLVSRGEVINPPGIILGNYNFFNFFVERKLDIDACFILDIDNMLSLVDYETTFNAFIYLKKIACYVKDIYVFTHNPSHYIFESINDSWEKFYEKELSLRRQFNFPPYGIMVKVILKGKDKNKLLKRLESLYNRLKEFNLEIFGPVEEFPFKVRDNYGGALVIKGKNRKMISDICGQVIQKYKSSAYRITVIVR